MNVNDFSIYDIQFIDNTAEEGMEARRQVEEVIDALQARIASAEALLREVTTSIEFDELGLGELRERIVRFLVP